MENTTTQDQETTLFLAEPPHRVLQGEGPNLGKKMILLRLFGCNVQCPACDSYHTWRAGDLAPTRKKVPLTELVPFLVNELRSTGTDRILISGGEPQLHQESIRVLIIAMESYYGLGIKYDIETTGERSWELLQEHFSNIQFNLSPKIGALSPKNIPSEHQFFTTTLQEYRHRLHYVLKVVVRKEQAEQDLSAIQEFASKYAIPSSRIYLMPFGTTKDQIIDECEFWIPKAFELGYEVSPRMHILIYGNRRLV